MKKSYYLSRVLILLVLFSLSTLCVAGRVNINRADSKTLAAHLNGVGLKKAQAIVSYRRINGQFQSSSELTNVKGIGTKTVEKNQHNIVLRGASDPVE